MSLHFWRRLVLAAVPLASFLSFSVQPMMGKYLVPWHGGSASTWTGAMVYFQAVLVMGYAWASWLLRRPLQTQVRATGVLSVIAATTTLLPPLRLGAAGGMAEVFLSLTAATLPAMLLLFGTSILLQGWLWRHHAKVPYFLYAVSNIGSLVALVAYPFIIEPYLGLGVQAVIWRSGLAGLALILISAGWWVAKNPGSVAEDTPDAGEEENVGSFRKMAWVCFSALTCICMIGATHHLSAEIGSNPLSWIMPLGLYLMSFSLTFTGWWPLILSRICTGLLAVCLTGFVLLKGVGINAVEGWTMAWLLGVVLFTSLVGTGLLYSLRPRRQFTSFYLAIGVGGMLGGMVASLGAPNILNYNFEFILAALLVVAAGAVMSMGRPSVSSATVVIVVAMAPVIGMIIFQLNAVGDAHAFRNLYGQIRLKLEPDHTRLWHETTLHGMQIMKSETTRRWPTLYYTESGGAGVVVRKMQAQRPSIEAGVIGLGAGTLATYSRAGDRFVFWDIDPKVFMVARTAFTFVGDARGKIDLREADGRKAIESWAGDLDLIVVDAFSGDAVPAHLLTQEALSIFLSKIKHRNGVLLIHASNRYADLFPVVAAGVRALGYEALSVFTEIERPGGGGDMASLSSHYIIVHAPESREVVASWFPVSEDGNRVKRTLRRFQDGETASIWTDGRHSILDVLSVRDIFDSR